jgi:uncharacterized protein (TIGR03435 family)
MKMICIAATLLAATGPSILLAQKPSPAKGQRLPDSTEPLIVDVHASPYRPSITYTVNISHRRFDLRNATIVNMVDFVLGRDDDDGREDAAIAGGPTWIDFDRFDVAAMIPGPEPTSPNDGQPNYGIPREDPYGKIRPIVKRVLTERFHLKYHTEERPLPGYAVTAGKDGAKLADAKDPTAPNDCQGAPDKSNAGQIVITCTSETVAQFIATFGSVFRHPLIDRTGLGKPYDFKLKLSAERMQTREDSIHAYIDGCSKQLGLEITPGNVPQPAVFVDTVEQRPTANLPQTTKVIATLPEMEFEVASIRPSSENEPQSQIRPGGSRITFTNFALQELLRQAWQLPTGAMLGNAPSWLSQVRYTIVANLPPEIDARAVTQDQDELDEMLQKLLVERFRIKYHWGQQVQDGYVLAAGTPKMKKADPTSRSFCKYGPAEGEKDVRRVESPFNGEFHCQNVTMAQLADLAQAMAKSEIKNRVVNKSGLDGSYDFTLYYTTDRKLRLDAAAMAKQSGDAPSDPAGGFGIEDAFRKELGLKLEKRRSSYPALILDSIEKTPTEN